MEEQWNVICYLAKLFEINDIEYQFDASTSVFIHGVEFIMDDIDVIILKQYKDKVIQLLSDFNQTEIEIIQNSMEYFFAEIENQKVHLMFPYSKQDCTEETRDIIHHGVNVHTKTMEFYRRYIKEDNPLLPLIDRELKRFINA